MSALGIKYPGCSALDIVVLKVFRTDTKNLHPKGNLIYCGVDGSEVVEMVASYCSSLIKTNAVSRDLFKTLFSGLCPFNYILCEPNMLTVECKLT